MDRLDPITRQIALEQEYTDTGYAMALARIRTAEEKGQASRNPYASRLLRDLLPPLSAALRADMANPQAGWHKRAIAPLEGLDADALSFLVLRHAINLLEAKPISKFALELATVVYRELVLSHIADTLPDLYHVVSTDLDRRLSKDERHRYSTLKLQAQRSGIEIPTWAPSSRADVGAYLLGHLSAGGIVALDKGTGVCMLAEELVERMDTVTQAFAMTMPHVGPCLTRPAPRTADGNGGFLSPRLAARFRLSRGANEFGSTVLACVNALQDTAFQVNEEVLDIAMALAHEGRTGELLVDPESGLKRPVRPDCIPEGVKSGDLPEELQGILKAWKAEMRVYHERLKLSTAARARCVSALRVAQRFRQEPSIHFVYFADTRGRMYPASSGGVSPQGSDLQKALLRFAEGLPLTDDEAVMWFKVNGANRWGFDKAPLTQRASWVDERREQLLAMAEDPLNNREWLNADKPLQFLAWVLEYRDWIKYPLVFVSKLPVGLDGSCNG